MSDGHMAQLCLKKIKVKKKGKRLWGPWERACREREKEREIFFSSLRFSLKSMKIGP